MGRIAAVILVTLTALGASCSTEPDTPAGLRVTLQQSTLFETRRALRLGLRYEGDHDLQIGSIQLSSPLFESVPPEERDAVVRANGPGVIMPLPFGPARCDEVEEAPPQLITEVDGEEVSVAVDENPAGMLTGLHASECAAVELLEDVDVRFGARWEHTALRTAEGELELVQRRSGVTAAVDEMEGNVIFTVRTDDRPSPWLEVSDDQPSAAVPVVIHAARCDPHALIEYKKKYILPVWIRVADEEPVRLEIEAEGNAHRAMEELLAACLD